jgi:hypothetical protein
LYRYTEALLLTPPLPGIHKSTFCHLLEAILPKPSMKKVEANQHTRMDTQGGACTYKLNPVDP